MVRKFHPRYDAMDVQIVVFAVPLVIHEERSQTLFLLLMTMEVNDLVHSDLIQVVVHEITKVKHDDSI
jgi:hypothetical protein